MALAFFFWIGRPTFCSSGVKKGRSNGGGTAKFYWHSEATYDAMGAYLMAMHRGV